MSIPSGEAASHPPSMTREVWEEVRAQLYFHITIFTAPPLREGHE